MQLKSNRVFIYGECYSPITLVLYKHKQNYDVTLITINQNAKYFCDYLGIPCIYFKRIPLGINNMSNIFLFKRKIKSVIKLLKISRNDEFYIVDNSYIIEGFYFSSLLKHKMRLFYYKTIEVDEKFKSNLSRRYLVAMLNLFFINFTLELNLILRKVNERPILGIDSKFYSKNKIAFKDEGLEFYQMKKYVIQHYKINAPFFNIMYVDQGVGKGIIKDGQLQSIIDVLKTKLNNIVIKQHPKFQQTKIFSGFTTFPSFIPSEFLFSNIGKYVISIYSSTLILASKYKQLNAISLLELVEWVNEEYKNQMKQYLITESENCIIFIESFDELSNIIGYE